MKRKYPTSLFIIGMLTNIVFHFFWLFLPAVVIMIAGLFIRPCLVAGLIILLLDIVLSLIEQMKIRKAFLSSSDNPGFQQFQEALSKDGNWMENVRDAVEHINSEADKE